MRLKKLELFGFKSFADRTEVHFHKGVTCVVGPNGCGKSNISDSIRWVLGERSAKMLRGAKMEDVIFAGTEFRKPVAYAEVSLTIDNQDRGLPIDYNEVTITRRLHRSGESEYLINKTNCRLKDVQDLILDTGIGSNSYSMIEQGRIDYILNADADERRFLIEEAAGISKYKLKKEEAIRKLERTEQNLLRIRDIVAEVQRNIQYAERQAKRAQRYQEQFEKLRNLEIRRAFFELDQIRAELAGLGEVRRQQEEEIRLMDEKITACRRVQEEITSALRGILDRFSAEEARRYGLKAKMEQNEQQLRFHQEKRVELALRRGEIQQEKSQIQERLHKTAAEITVKQGEADGLEAEHRSAEEGFSVARQTLNEIEDHLEAAKSLFDDIKAQALEAASSAVKVRNEYHKVTAFLETSVEQKKRQEAGANRYRLEMNQWQARKDDCEQSLRHFEGLLEQLSEQKGRSEQEAQSLRDKIRQTSEVIESMERSLHEKETRRNLLKEIDAASGLSREAILQELNEEERGYVRHLRDVLHVESGYEVAVEAVLGEFAHALVTGRQDTAARLLGLMAGKKSAPAGLLVAEENTEPPSARLDFFTDLPEAGGALLDVVRIEEAWKPLIEPFFSRVYILNSFDPARFPELFARARQVQFVTREGLIIGPNGRVFFRQEQATAEHSFFKRGNEIEVLESEVKSTQASLEQSQAILAEAAAQFANAEAELEKIEKEFVDAKIQKESFESLRKGMQERLGSFQRELDLFSYEQNEILTREEEAISQRTLLEIEIMRCEERQRQVRSEQETVLRDMERMEKSKSAAFASFSDHKAKLDHLVERRRFLEEALALHREQEKRDRQRAEFLDAESARIQEREGKLDEEDTKLRESQAVLQDESRDCDVKLELIRQEKVAAEEKMKAEEETLLTFQDRKHEAETRLHNEEMKVMDLGYQEKNLHEKMQQSYKIDLATLQAAEYPMTEAERPEIEGTIAQLREKIESIGTVNLLAIEEYDELKQRFDFLMGQQKDLEDARDALMEAIRKINRTTKGLFETTFQEVQKMFGEYYKTLFRGGEAQLILVDEANPLESGVDIVVRPPGKKLQHISLLSGGEKAMTALALMYALFKIKPSPFCVMDEVDAPLDEANIDRFLAVLKTFITTSQFIIVTHNRKTIAMGDTLYGVTMQEAGVSRIVSVKVNTDAADEAFEEPAQAADDRGAAPVAEEPLPS